MKVIGILGGVASGKSFVADCFRELGAATLDGDRIGHEVLRTAEVEQAARDRWGDAIFDDEGHIDRRELAKAVFKDGANGQDASEELAFLESLTHERIGQRLAAEAEQLRQASGHPAAIIDAAVLLKAGWDHLCDSIIFVEVPEDIRKQRAVDRGWAPSELARREQSQLPLEAKRQRADTIIDNSQDRETTRRQVRQYWASMVESGRND